MKKEITIVTHSSKFHTDDIFAVATLLLLLEKENNVKVVRSRDREVIEAGDYVVDVGDEYNPDQNRFDHHQEGKAGERLNGIPYASFGLVWKKFGEQVCGKKEIAENLDSKLVQPIDAHDNGLLLAAPTIENVYSYDIDFIRKAFIPTWKEGMKEVDSIFLQCVEWAKILITREIIHTKDKLDAQELVEKTYYESEDKRLVVFDIYCPAGDLISKFPEPLFIVFPSSDGTWILKTIQGEDSKLINRKDLPAAWAGKSDDELEKITGVSGSIFCHNNRFIAVAKTREAILKLAKIAIDAKE